MQQVFRGVYALGDQVAPRLRSIGCVIGGLDSPSGRRHQQLVASMKFAIPRVVCPMFCAHIRADSRFSGGIVGGREQPLVPHMRGIARMSRRRQQAYRWMYTRGR